MEAIEKITSEVLVIDQNDIDTDQIIPARFLTVTTREGLGKNLFYDWRYDGNGQEKDDSVFNKPDTKNKKIIVAGNNFGCGSSREHAPWALLDYGFKVVISTEIADIFKNNSLKNGLLPVVVDKETHELLCETTQPVTVDLQESKISFGNHVAYFDVEPFARLCLLKGVDQLGFLQTHKADIEKFEKQRKDVA
jgi:3-isopropylmalate/(R)-2-methylmalate dehydratase small subunit